MRRKSKKPNVGRREGEYNKNKIRLINLRSHVPRPSIPAHVRPTFSPRPLRSSLSWEQHEHALGIDTLARVASGSSQPPLRVNSNRSPVRTKHSYHCSIPPGAGIWGWTGTSMRLAPPAPPLRPGTTGLGRHRPATSERTNERTGRAMPHGRASPFSSVSTHGWLVSQNKMKIPPTFQPPPPPQKKTRATSARTYVPVPVSNHQRTIAPA